MSEAYVIPAESIEGDDAEDTALLLDMVRMSERFVRSYSWCAELREGKFTDGIGGIVAICLFRVLVRGCSDDEWIWVMGGDVPSVYFPKNGFQTPREALERYVEGLEEWVAAARAGRPMIDLIPIGVDGGNAELVDMVATRCATLREHILPEISACAF